MVENENGPVQPAEPARKKQYLGIVVVAALLLSLFSVCWLYFYAVSPGALHGDSEIRVYIPPRSGVSQIKSLLSESGVIDDDIRFVLLTKVLGAAKKLKAGEYLFAPGSSPLQIIEDLAAGKTVLRSVTIAEGFNIFQMADIFAEQGWSPKESFLALLQSQDFIRSLDLNVDSLEGYLFPDTYFFPKGEDIRAIVRKMVEKGRQVMDEECQNSANEFFFACSGKESLKKKTHIGTQKKGVERTLSTHQILTLASIIEKEASLENERPLVSRVFLNRLDINMRLQADPTLIYGLQKFGEPLTRVDLKTPGPYNTYLNKGLPPGPICSPGQASIRAVFQSSEGSYYYFVSQNDGSHSFSKSLREHNKAVKRYRELTKKK